MNVNQLIEKLGAGDYDGIFAKLYPTSNIVEKRERFIRLARCFDEMYGSEYEVSMFSVPGRTELSGNHTDHNSGCVLAGSVDIDIIAIAAPISGSVVRMKSEGYREDVVDISNPDPSTVRKGSSASLLAGISDYFNKHGFSSGGFVAYTTSDVMTGSGLSSSAAFEVMCAKIFSEFYCDGKVTPMEMAKAGKYAENVYFGKPCGLMDQAACASGGCLYIDFADSEDVVSEKIDFDLAKQGYTLCIVNTGGNHADLTDDYASVPGEMKSVAALMGKSVLRLCNEQDFMNRISYLRSIVGDRAILRAMHYFAENNRVNKQREALLEDRFDDYLALVRESGNSSFKFLQNVYTNQNPAEQGISLALAITERFGAICRVHGGGFAGTIQAYIPTNRAEEYINEIESVFGKRSCFLLSIRPYGAAVITEEGIKG